MSVRNNDSLWLKCTCGKRRLTESFESQHFPDLGENHPSRRNGRFGVYEVATGGTNSHNVTGMRKAAMQVTPSLHEHQRKMPG